jgi:hypothetical protein
MKTPRQLLLARHALAESKLDTVREGVLATSVGRRTSSRQAFLDRLLTLGLYVPRTLWHELIQPSRRLWTALATIWILIFLINFSQRDPVSSVTGQPVRSQSVTMSWQMQQRLMNELLADRAMPPDADRPRNTQPRPRTQIIEMMAT